MVLRKKKKRRPFALEVVNCEKGENSIDVPPTKEKGALPGGEKCTGCSQEKVVPPGGEKCDCNSAANPAGIIATYISFDCLHKTNILNLIH